MARPGPAAFLSVVLVVCLPALSLTQDCTKESDLPNANRRDKDSSLFNPSDAMCDLQLEKSWYRAKTDRDLDLATTCPLTNHCGTLNPIWMNGTIPMNSEGAVDRTACVVNSTSCCASTIAIRVYNCGSYRLFYLAPAPAGDCSAYCVEPAAVLTTSTATTNTTQTTVANGASSANSSPATTSTNSITTISTPTTSTTTTPTSTSTTTVTTTTQTTAANGAISANSSPAITTTSSITTTTMSPTSTSTTTTSTSAASAATSESTRTTASSDPLSSSALTSQTSQTTSPMAVPTSGGGGAVSPDPATSSSALPTTTRGGGSSSSSSSPLNSEKQSSNSQGEGQVVTVIIAAIAGGLTVLVVVLVAAVIWYRRRPSPSEPAKADSAEQEHRRRSNSYTPMDQGESQYTSLAPPVTVISEAGYMDMTGIRARPPGPQSVMEEEEEGTYTELPAVTYANDEAISPFFPPALPARGVQNGGSDDRTQGDCDGKSEQTSLEDYDDFTVST